MPGVRERITPTYRSGTLGEGPSNSCLSAQLGGRIVSWKSISMLWKMTFTADDILSVCEDEIHEDIEMNEDLKDDIEQWMANNSE